jgi:hypothetical protein
MEYEYMEVPIDEGELIFTKFKCQVANCSKSMTIIMVTLKKRINPLSKQSESQEKLK